MRYAIFAYDESVRQYSEFIYDNYEECEIALGVFTDYDIAAFICVSDESMNGKIAEVLLRPGSCFNA
jgi:hypothetical protein